MRTIAQGPHATRRLRRSHQPELRRYRRAAVRDHEAAEAERDAIAVAGRNCWQVAHASRVACLVDAAAYFAAFAAAVERAERSILMTSWDIDTRTRLWPEGTSAPVADPTLPPALGEFLNTVVARRPGLQVHVLNWDFAMLFAFEREIFPVYKFDWRTHRRLRFRLDASHPLGGSHHQKIVVIDDAVAFSGGLDVCMRRWDTPQHRALDARRVDVAGRPYEPFHDVQIMVDGEAARALGVLVRERWWRATGRRLPPPPGSQALGVARDPWPPAVTADLENVAVAIARTEPAFAGRSEVREVEALFLDAIAAARRVVYIENQYLTSARIGDALVARLGEPRGPEIVIIMPRECSGWLEERTMGVLRGRLLERLHAADRFARLRVYHPTIQGERSVRVNVHSKVLIVDGSFLRVGSANLSNRSMGLDTECDLAIDARGQRRIEASIRRFRNRLVAEHLGLAPEAVAEAIASQGSLVGAVEALRGAPRTLESVECAAPAWIDALVPDGVDPERPVDPDRLIEEFVPEDVRGSIHHPILRAGAIWLALAALVTLGKWLGGMSVAAPIDAWLEPVRQDAAAPLWAVAAFVGGGLLLVPISLLMVGSLLIFGGIVGAAYALLGILASATVTYALGRALGRDAVRRLAGRRLNRLSRRLVRRGPMAVAATRLLAIAPFTVTNLVAGASRVPARDYALGTLFGTLPGVIVIGLVTSGQGAFVHDRVTGYATVLTVIGTLLTVAGAWLARRRQERSRMARAPSPLGPPL